MIATPKPRTRGRSKSPRAKKKDNSRVECQFCVEENHTVKHCFKLKRYPKLDENADVFAYIAMMNQFKGKLNDNGFAYVALISQSDVKTND